MIRPFLESITVQLIRGGRGSFMHSGWRRAASGMTETTKAPGRLGGIADQTWLLMMLPGLFWAGNAVLGRAVAGEVPPVALAFWRWTVAAALVLPFAWRHLRGDLRPLLRAWPVVLALSALGVGAFNTCLYIAAQTTSALNIVLLQSAMPVLVVAATLLLFRETPSARQASGVAVSRCRWRAP